MSSAASSPLLARTRDELSAGLAGLREGVGRIGLVPTMGSLHEGHLSLVDRSREEADATVVSIFVNPLQFGAGEDLAAYPRDLGRDLEVLRERGVDLVFAPKDDVMYPHGDPTVQVDPGPQGERLCGRYRPGHFRGVLTVVAKLFGLVRPDLAVFGRKDFQQSMLIRHMVDDLELGTNVIVAPVVREADGLAMSSRNLYLSDLERRDARGLFAALSAARSGFGEGERSAEELVRRFHHALEPFSLLRIQYVELVDPRTLDPVDPVAPETVMATAAFCGETRLIDNVDLGGEVAA